VRQPENDAESVLNRAAQQASYLRKLPEGGWQVILRDPPAEFAEEGPVRPEVVASARSQ